jgi:hypothetical protein
MRLVFPTFHSCPDCSHPFVVQIVDKGSSAAYTLKSHYQRLLLPYEDHCKAQTNEGAGLLGKFEGLGGF